MLAPQRVLAEVYRLHHVPLPSITLQALLQRGPRAASELVHQLASDEQARHKWKKDNEARIVESAQLLHREVPIRLARRIVDLENLPNGLPDAPSIVKLRQNLLKSFEEMIDFPQPRSLDDDAQFIAMHQRIRAEHGSMHSNLSEALRDLKHEPEGLSELLDDFYYSRIGIRMLVDQHISAQNPVPGFSGIIADACSPMEVAKNVVEKVRPLWQAKLAEHQLPEFHITGQLHATYRYIPSHTEIILSEVLKNAVRNSVQACTSSERTPQPVSVLVAGGAQGMCIKVSDQGGGMTREDATNLFSYIQSPGPSQADAPSTSQQYDPVAAAIDSRASELDFLDSFGLRISSLYAQYFGGALALMPVEGHGVDAYIYLNCLTEESQLK